MVSTTPTASRSTSEGRIFVSDSNHNRVTAFSPEGTVLWNTGSQITSLTATSTNPFVLPRGIAVLPDGAILVADPLAHQLVRLTSAGKFVVNYGERGQEPGQAQLPDRSSE